jgi:hypothetical protein
MGYRGRPKIFDISLFWETGEFLIHLTFKFEKNFDSPNLPPEVLSLHISVADISALLKIFLFILQGPNLTSVAVSSCKNFLQIKFSF